MCEFAGAKVVFYYGDSLPSFERRRGGVGGRRTFLRLSLRPRLVSSFSLSLSLSLPAASRRARARRDEVFVPRGSLICVSAGEHFTNARSSSSSSSSSRAEQRGVQVSRKEEKKCALTTRRKDRAWRPSFSFSFSLA